ncbi:skp1 family, dimerization domain-containing protein [Ditylenchus destructor]|uniref:Skp1-related protein n=1 Tax=Ditylenchus destructor TaxID=166010 RepID=A0AAD4MMM7_9BILA|nr:skp1 family, dimerization domain-containing protein [Ditylenchus destructor]
MESEEAGPGPVSTSQMLACETSSRNIIACKTADGDTVHVEIEVMNQSKAFKEAAEQPDFTVFSAETVKTPIFIKIVDWCRQRIGVPEPVVRTDPRTGQRIWFKLTEYEKKFFAIPVPEIVEIMESAKQMQVESLYIYCAQSMANRIKNMTPEEIRQTLGLEDDLTLKEKFKIRKEHRSRMVKGDRRLKY